MANQNTDNEATAGGGAIPAGAAAERTQETRRRIPRASWSIVGVVMLLLTLAGVAGWELKMRALGLTTADMDDSDDHWAEARRAVRTGGADHIVIVGDSRIWFDTDLDAWVELTGRRPVQLALEGTGGRRFLRDLAQEEQFRGLAIVGVAEWLFFSPGNGVRGGVIDHWRKQSLARRFGHQVYLRLSPWFAFLDRQYTPHKLFRWLDLPSRQGVVNPARLPWKLSESYAHRQTFLWPRVEKDIALRDNTRATWLALTRFVVPPPQDAQVQQVVEEAAEDVRRIRARGGEVVFVRPPSGGALLETERELFPRARLWDRLLQSTEAFGVHWEDYPEMRGLETPEWSHLDRPSATRFTRAYVGVLRERVPWLRERLTTAAP